MAHGTRRYVNKLYAYEIVLALSGTVQVGCSFRLLANYADRESSLFRSRCNFVEWNESASYFPTGDRILSSVRTRVWMELHLEVLYTEYRVRDQCRSNTYCHRRVGDSYCCMLYNVEYTIFSWAHTASCSMLRAMAEVFQIQIHVLYYKIHAVYLKNSICYE